MENPHRAHEQPVHERPHTVEMDGSVGSSSAFHSVLPQQKGDDAQSIPVLFLAKAWKQSAVSRFSPDESHTYYYYYKLSS